MTTEPQQEDTWVATVTQALPGLIVAIAAGAVPIGIAIVGFLWQQTISLARMNETLTMVCKQLEEKKAVDREQDRRLLELERVTFRANPVSLQPHHQLRQTQLH